MTGPVHRNKKTLPVWLLGLANLPLGLTGGLALLTVPQWLASRHVAEPVIAGMTTLALIPTFLVFLLGPVFDIWFSRRTYAIASTLFAASSVLGALLAGSNLTLLGAAMLCSLLGAAANAMAIGGWFGTMVPKEKDVTLGAWMNIANIGGFGLIAAVGMSLIRALPPPAAGAVMAAPCLVPLLIYARTSARPPDRRLARESFGAFFRDLGALLKRPIVLQTLLLFAVPDASFALTNTLGGLGGDYHASEGLVSLIGGAAGIGAGVIGSLLVPPFAMRSPARVLYLGIGFVGALFTLSLIIAPRTPGLFAIALTGQDIFQSAALATVNVIALQSLGKNNPFAATQFGLLVCASALPITYMQLVDGHAYGAGGLTLMYLTDGGLGLLACSLMFYLLRVWARRTCVEPEELPASLPGV
jgi:PAT family beta-lactamase induction signal transducer AmpG